MAARADVPRAVRIGPRERCRGLIFVRTFPWFHGKRLRDTFHRTMGSIERWQHSGGSRWRRSCHSMNRDRAGRYSASAPTGDTLARLIIFSGARRATAGSMHGITYGLRITKARCRTRRKIKRNRLHGRSASLVVRANLKGGTSRAHRADAWGRCADDHATLLQWIAW